MSAGLWASRSRFEPVPAKRSDEGSIEPKETERGASVGAGLSIARARRCLIETMRALRAYTGARRASPLRAGMHAVHESSSQQLAPITALADANFDYLAELL